MSDPICIIEDRGQTCGRPCWDQAYMCEKHGEWLAADLAKVPHLVEEMDIVRARLTAAGDYGFTAASLNLPLPFDARVTEVHWALTNTLTTWARVVVEERGITEPRPNGAPDGPRCEAGIGCRHDSCQAIREQRTQTVEAAAALWLIDQIRWLRHHPAADEAHDELTAAIRAVERMVDVNPERLYLGPCGQQTDPDGDPLDQPCMRDLYAAPGTATTTCPQCATVHDVKDRRDWVMAQAENHLGSAGEVSALCRHMLGDMVTPAMIRGYVRRGTLMQHPAIPDKRGKLSPVYRVGDVVKAAYAASQSPKSRREARKDARDAEEALVVAVA